MNILSVKIFFGVLFMSGVLYADLTIAFAKNSTVYQNEPSPSQTIDINKIKKIAKKYSINVHFKSIPWKRAVLLLEKGMIDGLINASYKTSRAQFAKYPMDNGIVNTDKKLNNGNTYYIYRHKQSSLHWDGKKFINGGRIGVKENYAVIDDLKKHDNIKIQKYITNSEIIRKVASRKLDGYAASYEEANSLLDKFPQFTKDIVKETVPIRKKEYFLIFSKKSYKTKSQNIENIWLGLEKINTHN